MPVRASSVSSSSAGKDGRGLTQVLCSLVALSTCAIVRSCRRVCGQTGLLVTAPGEEKGGQRWACGTGVATHLSDLPLHGSSSIPLVRGRGVLCVGLPQSLWSENNANQVNTRSRSVDVHGSPATLTCREFRGCRGGVQLARAADVAASCTVVAGSGGSGRCSALHWRLERDRGSHGGQIGVKSRFELSCPVT
jgi:hypothetical protein